MSETAYIAWSPDYGREAFFGRTEDEAKRRACYPNDAADEWPKRRNWRVDPFPLSPPPATT